MADKAADLHTLAPRLSYVEDLAAWLKDNRGEGGGTLDEKLWKATLTGAVTGGTWSDTPWTTNNLLYGPGSPNDMSMHLTVFGTDATGAMKCQDGKGLYGWVFPPTETRWQYGAENRDHSLAVEIFDQPDSGYVHALRAATLSLMEAIFKDPSYIGPYSIIDRILDIVQEVEELATNIESEIERLDARIDALANG